MSENLKSDFIELRSKKINDIVEKKGKFDYLSWAHAWDIIKTAFPNANYVVYENKDGLNYHHDTRTAWVKVGAIINDLEHIEYLPVMDNKNQSIQVAKITSFDVNKAIQRATTKAFARHGLGLSLYAGEDLPDILTPEQEEEQRKQLEHLVNQTRDLAMSKTLNKQQEQTINTLEKMSYGEVLEINSFLKTMPNTEDQNGK